MALSRLLDTTPPRLLTVAACGGLEPAPDSRLRGTYPHLLHSIAPPFVSAFVAHGRLLKPRPRRPQRRMKPRDARDACRIEVDAARTGRPEGQAAPRPHCQDHWR